MDPARLSLADFYYCDGPDPLTPPEDYAQWRRDGAWATALYEPDLLAAPTAHTSLRTGGKSRDVINLASYNYLGLATHPDVIQAAHRALDEFGTGACGSPILSGRTALHTDLERELASFMGRESILLFNSGYGGGLGTITALLRKGDVAILDEKCHLCLVDGAKLSRARVELFSHNDPGSLDALVRKHEGKRRLVVLEGIYSMDGDMADLSPLMEVTRRHKVSVMIDEAHSILVWGDRGRGVAEYHDCQDDVGLVFATFSKAFAGLGGFIAGRRETLDYIRFYANSYGFSCALPPATIAALREALRIANEQPERKERLQRNAERFRAGLNARGISTGDSTSQVVPIMMGADRQRLYRMGHELLERGVFVAPVDYPSVPEDGLRFRASITAAHDPQSLDRAVEIFAEVLGPGDA